MVGNTWRPEYGPDPLAGFVLSSPEHCPLPPTDVHPCADPLDGRQPFEVEPRDPLIVPSRRYRPTRSSIRIRETAPRPQAAPQPVPDPPEYLKWRPQYHLLAPRGWINDPCGPLYNATTKLYQLSFQWNPDGPKWASGICWGHAVSRDLVNWEVFSRPIVSPAITPDSRGAFSGCMIQHSDDLLIFYTAATGLIHYTKPYSWGNEALCALRSSDNGKSWSRVEKEPLLPGPPKDFTVTGWRDPYLGPWKALDQKITSSSRTVTDPLYATISGGIKGKGPTCFLYSTSRQKPLDWTYHGTLIDMPENYGQTKWTADFGLNWEVCSFLTLRSEDAQSVECLAISAEGTLPFEWKGPDAATSHARRGARNQLWMFGTLEESKTGKMNYVCGGLLDHGNLYAANPFWDPKIERHIVFGWVPEDDLTADLTQAQGWAGVISIPRELYLQTISNVTRAIKSELSDITSICAKAGAQSGTFTVTTLGITPARALDGLRILEGAFDLCSGGPVSLLPLLTSSTTGKSSAPIQTRQFSVKASISVSPTCSSTGFAIYHGSIAAPDQITVAFYPEDEKIVIDRGPAKGSEVQINTAPDIASHTLFYQRQRGSNEKLEDLTFDVFYDGSVLEIFANERTAITTRLYPTSPTIHGLIFFAEDRTVERTKLTKCLAWDGLASDSYIVQPEHCTFF